MHSSGINAEVKSGQRFLKGAIKGNGSIVFIMSFQLFRLQ